MPKRAIPAVPPSAREQGRVAFDDAMKDNMERLVGKRGGLIVALPPDATTAQIISKINEIIERLQ